MSISMIASLFLATAQATVPTGCEEKAPVRDPQICEPLFSEGDFVIYSMESVAVGTAKEMQRIREMTSHCGLSNRIDHLGGIDLAVFDIFDATAQSRACVRDWIAENAPELVYSQERFDERFQTALPIEKSGPSL